MRSVCIQSNMNVIRGLVKRAQLLWKLHNISDTCTTSLTRAQHLWHVHNISDTCTTSLKRAQHLWHVHNISDTCTTSLKRAHIEYLKTLGGGGGTRYTHIYIYRYGIQASPMFLINSRTTFDTGVPNPKIFPTLRLLQVSPSWQLQFVPWDRKSIGIQWDLMEILSDSYRYIYIYNIYDYDSAIYIYNTGI